MFVAVLALGAPPALAADITGAWDLPSGDIVAQTWTFTAGTGTLAGEGAGGFYTWPMEGTITGDAVQVKTAYRASGYVAYFVGVVSPDGAKMSGTWATGGFGVAATSLLKWSAVRRGGVPGATKPAGVQVVCNRGPDPDSVFLCTATVGGSSAPPTGTVKWASTKGGFPFADTCTLVATPLSPNVSSCSVTWSAGPGGLAAGIAPPVTATYAGDAKAGAASGAPQLYGIASFDNALPPNLCAFNASCDGIDVLISGKPKLNVKTRQLAKLTAGCYGTGAGGTAAAHAAQIPTFTCGASAEAILSAAGDAQIETMLSDAQKLLSSPNKKDQLKGQKLVLEATKRFNQITQALQAAGELATAGIDLTFDAAMTKAQKLLASPSKKDQLLGQKLVQQANQRLQSDIQTLEQRSEQLAKQVNSSSVRKRRALTIASARVKVAGGKRGTLALRAGRRQRRVLTALRKAGLRSVTLRLQLGGSRSGDPKAATTQTTLKVALR